jgi:2-(1,2-epoxy-1,2-dihydrophenyl)acetyl-CoA isomerase
MNNPATFNGMDQNLGPELSDGLEMARRDPKVRALVLTGAGRAFSGGGNLKGVRDFLIDHPDGSPAEVFAAYTPWVSRVATLLHGFGKPVVAAVNGPASGGGLAWVLFSDLAVMSSQAKLSAGFSRVGLVPGAGVSLTLTRQVGRLRAAEMLLLNRELDAGTALEWGLVNRVVPPEEVAPTAQALAGELAMGSARSNVETRRLCAEACRADLTEQLDRERVAVDAAADDPEFRRLLEAFFTRTR